MSSPHSFHDALAWMWGLLLAHFVLQSHVLTVILSGHASIWAIVEWLRSYQHAQRFPYRDLWLIPVFFAYCTTFALSLNSSLSSYMNK